jgi:hypothetical protein
MPDDKDHAKPKPHPDQEDLLSPTRALRESAAHPSGQRVGDSGPVANPDVSPLEPED